MRKRLLALAAATLSLLGLAVPAAAEPGIQYSGPWDIGNWGIQGRCVDIPDGDGPMVENVCDNSVEQKFYFSQRGTSPDGQPYFWIWAGGGCLDLPFYGSVPPATPVGRYECRDDDNQHWRVEKKFMMFKRNWFWIRNTASGLCLDIPGVKDAQPGVRLEVYPCRSGDDHEWRIGENFG